MTARRFYITLFITVVAAVAIDVLIGVAGSWLTSSAKGGHTARHRYINCEMKDFVIVFGSSRALHHYDPRILADTLGMSAYNAGADGNGVLLSYMQLSNILDRYTPSVVLYDLYGQYDFMNEPDKSKYLGWERAYYGSNAALDSVFHAVDAAERWKMLSSAYRYNSRLLQLLSDNISPRQSDIHGYQPMDETATVFREPAAWPSEELDDVKLEYIRRLAEKCRERGVTLVVAVSPYYFPPREEQLPARVRKIFGAYDVPVLDHSRDTLFLGHGEYFSDSNHLNTRGAEKYTRRVATEVKTILHDKALRDNVLK